MPRALGNAASILLVLFGWGNLQVIGAEEIHWLTAKPLENQLASPISIEWFAAKFRPALERLSRAQRLAVVIDRRIDPDAPCGFKGDEEPLSEVFSQLAQQAGCGYTQLGPVAYFGPEDISRKLRTLAAQVNEQVEQLPPAASRIWRRSRAWHWGDFASPRQLLEGLANEHGIKLVGLEQIPHDLWAEADVPPLPLAERMLLIAAQFDLTLELDPQGRSAQLVRIPLGVALRRRYAARGNANQLAQQYRSLLPDADIEVEGRDVVVDGLLEDHERIVAGTSTKENRPTVGAQVFRLKVENIPVSRLLDYVSKQMGYVIKVDEEAVSSAGLSLDERVSVDVKDATIDDLMKAILKPVGLQHHRRERVLNVTPISP